MRSATQQTISPAVSRPIRSGMKACSHAAMSWCASLPPRRRGARSALAPMRSRSGPRPRRTHPRPDRGAGRGRQSGRTQETQRLMGRTLRAITDLPAFGERQIRIDCDALQADGGTRTAAITGSYVALYQALAKLSASGLLPKVPLNDSVAAISCGVCEGVAVLDLDYAEDSQAQTDANFVLTGSGGVFGIQATAPGAPVHEDRFGGMLTPSPLGGAEPTPPPPAPRRPPPAPARRPHPRP